MTMSRGHFQASSLATRMLRWRPDVIAALAGLTPKPLPITIATHSELRTPYVVLGNERLMPAIAKPLVVAAEAIASPATEDERLSAAELVARIANGQRWLHHKGSDYRTWSVVEEFGTGRGLVLHRPNKPQAKWWLRPLETWFERVGERQRFEAAETGRQRA